MSEINDRNGIKIIAHYLPQFHCIPENDKWWGKDFTEWTNTKKAKPLFDHHYQPRVPYNNFYYNLLDDDVKIWQAETAKKYGIFGFCYYHYWFKGGKKLLERPAEQMLKNKNVDIPFCFCWANENWTRNWDGGNREIIAEQDYGAQSEWIEHLDYLIKFFNDSRYITYDGAPLFLIYKPELIPMLNRMLEFWQIKIKEYGFKKICFAIQSGTWYFSPFYDNSRFDFQLRFEPSFSNTYRLKNFYKLAFYRKIYSCLRIIGFSVIFRYLYLQLGAKKNAKSNSELSIYNYDDIWNEIIHLPVDNKTVLGGFVDWDNTARNIHGFIYQEATPEKFGRYMTQLINKAKATGNKMVFINAWNEWAESAYLEPDEKFKFGYLENLSKALKTINNQE